MQVSGAVAVVTGAGSGIGRATALELAKQRRNSRIFQEMPVNDIVATVLDDLAGDFRTVDEGAAHAHVVLVGHKEDLVEFDSVPSVAGKSFDHEGLTWFYAVLFTAGFNNSVHRYSPQFSRY